ncbi:MAG: hypothetical protein WAN65_02785 [Candidatus Sulfotelmatobacter sp.]
MKKLKKLELKKVTLQDLNQPQLEQVGGAGVEHLHFMSYVSNVRATLRTNLISHLLTQCEPYGRTNR